MAETMTVNGSEHPIPNDPGYRRFPAGDLAQWRQRVHHGQCRACTVIVNGIASTVA